MSNSDTLDLYGLTNLPGLLDAFAAAVEHAAVEGDRESVGEIIDCREIILDTVAFRIASEVEQTIAVWSERAASAAKMMDAAKVALLLPTPPTN